MPMTRAVIACLLLTSAIRAAEIPARTLAIVNVTVIPMTSEIVVPGQTVIILGTRIAQVGPSSSVRIPSGAMRIDGARKYLMPGLWDAHVHLQQDEAVNDALLQLFLANGVTAVLNLYGTPLHLRLRTGIEKGTKAGPRIFTSGSSVGTPHGETPRETPEQIARETSAQKRAGYDVIKLHGDLTIDAYRSLIDASRRERLPLVGHAPRNLGVQPMLDLRQQAVAHAEEYLYAYFYYGSHQQGSIPELDTKIQWLARETARAGTAVISTIEVYRGIADQIENLQTVLNRPEVAYVPRSVGARWGWWEPNTYATRFKKTDVPTFRYHYGVLQRVMLAFEKAGVLLLAGTDTPTSAVVPGFSIHDELRDLVAAGLTPLEALRTATVNPSKFLSIQDAGTIAPGKRSDCVLLKRNPLDDIANTSAIAGVIRNGEWMTPESLLRGRNRVAEVH